ncbi:hypothetical protein FEM48_Zijuj10G0005800 [Ziziphus jujuba var. spinosa]|uniref:Uncharacterized protein n=1 Tax=Ziziphus jujuba var. spinosa TaxID=714518 RepID=A0A978UK87_ZIZJJ|nr:hypothetical protein FEM48_Zijuj10G0005800 [Ziziphus jujuba var. spinosa]
MKDLGPLTYFLVLEVHFDSSDTPLEIKTKYHSKEGDLISDPTVYQQLVGNLNYLTITSCGWVFPATSPLHLVAYSDADWAGCPNTRQSIKGWCMFLSNSLISWKSKKQTCVSKSSIEFEYSTMSATCSEIVWLHGLLTELGFSQSNPTPLHADNTGAIQIVANPVYHERTKHIEMDCHYIHEAFDTHIISLPHISTTLQIADVFTKVIT